MPNSLLTNPKLGDAFVYVCTIQRMSINLFGREAGIRFGEGDGGDEDASEARHPDPRLRPDRRRRVPPRLLGQGAVGLAQHAGLVRRHQGRPDRHAGCPHHGLLREPCVSLRLRACRPRGLPRRLRRRTRAQRCAHEWRVPPARASRSTRSIPTPVPGNSTCSRTSVPIDAAEVERKITAPDSNRKILEELKRYAEEHEAETGRFPKTLDLRRQRPAAHVARRSARRAGPRRLRPR